MLSPETHRPYQSRRASSDWGGRGAFALPVWGFGSVLHHSQRLLPQWCIEKNRSKPLLSPLDFPLLSGNCVSLGEGAFQFGNECTGAVDEDIAQSVQPTRGQLTIPPEPVGNDVPTSSVHVGDSTTASGFLAQQASGLRVLSPTPRRSFQGLGELDSSVPDWNLELVVEMPVADLLNAPTQLPNAPKNT